MRADVWLVENGLVSSRNRAQELIHTGRVFLLAGDTARKPVTKPSHLVGPDEKLEVELENERYVSRGGFKLKGALDRVRLDVRGLRVLDIGISTGGFTDCLLKCGAASIVGVDVGHGQLAPELQTDPRVKHFEGVNARDLKSVRLVQHNGNVKFDLAVADVSFISLTLVLPEAIQYLKEDGFLLALVKPQFEVGREGLGKNGIVKDPARYADVEEKIRRCVVASGWNVEDYFESSIEGSDGNREFFVFARAPRSRPIISGL